jgi:aspartate-semialdehyde dehydrogenase
MAATLNRVGKASVAVVGATGAVGRELLRCLEQRCFPVASLRLFASARSAGASLMFRGRGLPIEVLSDAALAGTDIALFSAGSSVSREWVPRAVRQGAVVIDNSSAFRMDSDVPLVIPEINASALTAHRGIIANPNCAAIVAITPLWPIHRANPIRRLVIATYQAASGAGAAAMAELVDATRAHLDGSEFVPRVLPHSYAFNLFSHDTPIDPATGYNEEETKVMNETRKIFSTPDLLISATCVRVPVLRAHTVAITVECAQPITGAEVISLLDGAPGVRLVDDRERNHFPMPIEATGLDDILVGRIRADLSDPTGRSFTMLACGDQLRKGAALNAVQIAERLWG